MSRFKNLYLAGAVAAVLAIGFPLRSLAQDSAAVAVNTKDGSSIFRLAFHVHRVMTGVVDQTNAAVAFSGCEECRTVAVALQLILIMSDPDVVSPENYAIAINSECSLCTTVALAYQGVLTTGGPVHFDAEGNRDLAEIRQSLRSILSNEDLSPEELESQFDSLVSRLKTVVGEHLVPAGSSSGAAEGTGDEGDASRPSPTASPSATPQAEEGTTSPSPEPAPTATGGGVDEGSSGTPSPS